MDLPGKIAGTDQNRDLLLLVVDHLAGHLFQNCHTQLSFRHRIKSVDTIMVQVNPNIKVTIKSKMIVSIL